MNKGTFRSQVVAGVVAAVAAWGMIDVASAATYELTVDSGTTDLAAAMAAQYPSATLAADDKIVKKGLGELTDSETALAKENALTVEACEGVFRINVQRKNCTWTVKKGAALRVSVSLAFLYSGNKHVKFNLEGSGTAECPGAIYFDFTTSTDDQHATFTLTDDAVIAFGTNTTKFNFSSCGASDLNNSIFYMNGHNLTFKELGKGSDSKYVRFRYAVNFVDPGRFILDGVWLTHLQSADFYVKKTGTAGYVATKLPIELKNGARINVSDDKIGSAIESLTCEAGTTIGQFNDTAVKAATIDTIIGCPTITADQTITIDKLLAAWAADIAADKKLTAAGTLGWAKDATCAIIGQAEGVAPGSSYVVAEVAAMEGAPAGVGETPLAPNREFSIATTDTQVEVSYTEIPLEDNDFVVFVEKGATKNLKDVTSGMTPEEIAALAGKRLVKFGLGTFYPNGNVSSLGFTSLAVLRGVYEVTKEDASEFPVVDGAVYVAVTNGATLKMGSKLDYVSNSASFNLTVAGAGAEGQGGAVIWTDYASAAKQRATFTLTGDTVFAFPLAGAFNFSNNDSNYDEWNRFIMNRHKLTFKNTGTHTGSASDYVRFRYRVNFVNPGTLELDGVWLTRYTGGDVKASATDGGATTLAVTLTNGARLNCANDEFASKISDVVCETGTSLGKVFLDTPSTFALAQITGCPTITDEQTVTLKKLVARTSDLAAGNKLTAAGTLGWAKGASCVVDGDVTAIQPETTYVAAEAGSMTGTEPASYDVWLKPICRMFTMATAEAASKKQLTVSYKDETVSLEANDFAVFSSSGTTTTLLDATNGMTQAEIAALKDKRLVKVGRGTFNPDGSVTNLEFSCLNVFHGIYKVTSRLDLLPVKDGEINVAVTNGATLEIGIGLNYLQSLGNFNLTVGGMGAEGAGGAVVWAVYSATFIQKATFTLTDDTVFAFPRAGDFNFSNSDYDSTNPNWNRFIMNRHKLTFRKTGTYASSDLSYVRFRYQVNFVNPGTLELDGVWLTRQGAGGVSVTATDSGATTLAMALKNGARLNCVNDTFASKLSDVACEDGTSLGKVFDAPSNITLAKITGCPTITDEQTVTLTKLVARAEDLAADSPKKLTAAGTLGWADGASCVIAGDVAGTMMAGTPYVVAEAAAMTGAAPSGYDVWQSPYYRVFSFATAEEASKKLLKVSYTSEEFPLGANDFAVFASSGTTTTLLDATNGMTQTEIGELAGKRLVKIGQGTFNPGGDVASLGFSDLFVRQGVYTGVDTNDFPIADNGINVAVTNGATLEMVVTLGQLKSLCDFYATVEGSGAEGMGGAIVFANYSGPVRQRAVFTLTDDAVFAFPSAGPYHFGNNNNGKEEDTNPQRNFFIMNRHKLTFKKTGTYEAGDSNYVRFRYQVNFVNPGTLELDGIWMSRQAGGVSVTATDAGATKLAMALKNGARLNCVNDTFADVLSDVVCDYGTSLGKVFTDAPSAFTLAKITGCPTITADQKVTVNALVARKADFTAGHYLTAAGAMGIGANCRVTTDELKGVTLPKEGFCIAQATDGFDNAPLRLVTSDDGARARVLRVTPTGEAEQLRLYAPLGMRVVIR